MAPRTHKGGPALGEAIRERRTALRLSIEEAAAKAGLGAKTWGRYEAGSAIRQDKVKRVAHALGWNRLPLPGNTDDDDENSLMNVPRDHDAWSQALEELYGPACAATFAVGSDILMDEAASDLAELARRPRGTHLGELDASWLDGDLPSQFVPRYDYEFVHGLIATADVLRQRFAYGHLTAHSVLQEIALHLIFSKAQLFADLSPDFYSPEDDWREWLGALLSDLDVEFYLFRATHSVPPGFTYHFDRWTEEQFWVDVSDTDDINQGMG